MSSSDPGSTSSSGTPSNIPQWFIQPGPGQLVLIAKKGEGISFPQYLEDALRRYELENLQVEPGLEASCGNRCGSQSIF